uniref:glutathione transferase n=1 Tax=Panagrolaimus davidi TaxID=227884 RepID=A0A914QU85_9BILA
MDPILMPWLVARKRPNPKYLTNEPPPKKQQLSLQPQFRLYSYCLQDMAETTRFILAYAGIDYEDIFIERFHVHRPDLTQWHFPCLEWNGKSIHDNDAIARMLAKMYGLAGDGVFEQAQADILVTAVRDLTNRIRNYLSGLFGMRLMDLVSF